MNMQQTKPAYKLYPSLLDAYQWYLDSENVDTAFQELIDKINRVPFPSEAADKGTAFNEIVDQVAFGGLTIPEGEKNIVHGGFLFKTDIVNEIAKEVKGGVPQVFCSGHLETKYGAVELYGYIDQLLPGTIVDTKTTKSYDKGKYLKNWQHIVYPYCLNQKTGAPYTFAYLITDFQRIYVEDYVFNPEKDTARLRLFCEDFIEFIETHKHLITDTKVFGGEKQAA